MPGIRIKLEELERMPEIRIKLGDFLRSFVYGSQYIEIVKSGSIVFCGFMIDFFKFIEDIEDFESVDKSPLESGYFVDRVLPVASVRNCTLVIYIHEETI